jgi:hypothetical protein
MDQIHLVVAGKGEAPPKGLKDGWTSGSTLFLCPKVTSNYHITRVVGVPIAPGAVVARFSINPFWSDLIPHE